MTLIKLYSAFLKILWLLSLLLLIFFWKFPAHLTSIPYDYFSRMFPEKAFQETNQNKVSISKNETFFMDLINNENIFVQDLSPSSNELFEFLIEWQTARTPKVLFPLKDSRGKTTQILFLGLAKLSDSHLFSKRLKNQIEKQILEAPSQNWGVFEKTLLAFLYLFRRYSYEELEILTSKTPDVESFYHLTAFIQRMPQNSLKILTMLQKLNPGEMPLLLMYLAKWNETGVENLSASLTKNPDAFHFLLKTQISVNNLKTNKNLPAEWMISVYSQFQWVPALIKYTGISFSLWNLIFVFFLINKQLRFGTKILSFLIPFLLIFLIIQNQEPDFLSQVQLPELNFQNQVISFSESTQTIAKGETLMNIVPLIFTLFFFSLQLTLFFIGKYSIFQIKKNEYEASIKLKLLENEDHLFDMGLYVGLSGTILSLIFLALGWLNIGLMSAYTSTLFGIIEVALLKLLYLRPYKHELITSEAKREFL